MEAEDTDAGDGPNGLGNARDLRPVLPFGEVRHGLEQRGWQCHSARAEGAVEVDGGTNKGQVRERLWEVAKGLAGVTDLLGVQPEVVGVGDPLLQGEACLFDTSG